MKLEPDACSGLSGSADGIFEGAIAGAQVGRAAGSGEADEGASGWDDLSREVYCVLGIPVDTIGMPALLRTVERAANSKLPFLISTPNLNFLINSRQDPEFRETLLSSELCPADGIAVVWIARLMGLPIKRRVAGSDMFDALRLSDNSRRQLALFLFGGSPGLVDAALKALNGSPGGLSCVGAMCPGFGTIEEMSESRMIEEINASSADFLVAALGARKGQLWLHRNHDRLFVPIRAHLGAAVGFTAGTLRRAPLAMRRMGLEWLWRIKEEPYLWRRYWCDGMSFLGLVLTRVVPLAVRSRWAEFCGISRQDLTVDPAHDDGSTTLTLSGACTARNVAKASPVFRQAVRSEKNITINLSNVRDIDARFLGLILMLRKQARKRGMDLAMVGAPSRLRRTFRLNGAEFLLDPVPGR